MYKAQRAGVVDNGFDMPCENRKGFQMLELAWCARALSALFDDSWLAFVQDLPAMYPGNGNNVRTSRTSLQVVTNCSQPDIRIVLLLQALKSP